MFMFIGFYDAFLLLLLALMMHCCCYCCLPAGGYDGQNNLTCVEMYDPQTDQWSMAPPMVAHEGGVGVGVITKSNNSKRSKHRKSPNPK